MSKSHTQRLREEQERRRKAREAREAEAHAAAAETAGTPETSGGAAVTLAASPATPAPQVAQRPQPFTPDLLPSTEAVDASGELSADELDELDRCERAFANADQAQWMRGVALHAVRDRRLYRHGGRTWPQYCEEIGLSESDANRMIQEYPLARAIAQIWVSPKMVPASHVRALLELVPVFDLEPTARGYVKLRAWAQENGHRVTAADLAAMTKQSALAAPAYDTPLPVAEFQARRRAIDGPVPPQPGPPPGETDVPAPAPEAASESRPNLGEPTVASGSLDHPNLGGPAAGPAPSDISDDDIVHAELVDDGPARELSAALARLQQDIDSTLIGASPETLKAIAASANAISTAAQDALTGAAL
ncbi:hypothetical protein ABZX75_32965 [Streptomyces sp. NPDC003038]|uniref:hypothetical protein n=1 Tax=unclassified Streptomyces TaxID=2593676 RepID=UPI0033A87DAB